MGLSVKHLPRGPLAQAGLVSHGQTQPCCSHSQAADGASMDRSKLGGEAERELKRREELAIQIRIYWKQPNVFSAKGKDRRRGLT